MNNYAGLEEWGDGGDHTGIVRRREVSVWNIVDADEHPEGLCFNVVDGGDGGVQMILSADTLANLGYFKLGQLSKVEENGYLEFSGRSEYDVMFEKFDES